MTFFGTVLHHTTGRAVEQLGILRRFGAAIAQAHSRFVPGGSVFLVETITGNAFGKEAHEVAVRMNLDGWLFQTFFAWCPLSLETRPAGFGSHARTNSPQLEPQEQPLG